MLIKHSTHRARNAMFPSAAPVGQEPPGPPEPSRQDLEIAGLRRENDALRGEIATLRAAWQDELSRAEARARDEAGQSHVRDDALQRTMLGEALQGARLHFENELLPLVGQWATEIAMLALEKLVSLRQGDDDWLARVVARRLAALDADAVIALHLSPSDRDGEDNAALPAGLPPGTRIETDPTLRPGMARLQLRLGTIDIDPAAGFVRLRDMLDAGAGNG